VSKSNKNLDNPKRIKIVGKKKNRFKYNINDIILDATNDYETEFSLLEDEDEGEIENYEKNYIS
jgi:hypothetical protein